MSSLIFVLLIMIRGTTYNDHEQWAPVVVGHYNRYDQCEEQTKRFNSGTVQAMCIPANS